VTQIALRPRSVSELLDAAVQLLKLHYGQFVVIAGVAYLPIIAVQIAAGIFRARATTPDFTNPPTMVLIVSFITGIVVVIWSTVAEGAIVAAASEAYMGQTVTPRAALGNALRRAGTLLGAAILRSLIIGVAGGIVAVPLAIVAAMLIPISPILGGLMAVPAVVGVFFAVSYVYMGLLTIPASVMLEKNGVTSALGRSWRLSDGLRWKALGAWLLVILIILLTSGTVQVVFTVLEMTTVAQIAGSVLQIFVYPLVGIVVTLLYYDARIRKEGLDLELMAGGLGGAVGSQPAS
jgi:hypothetical protein